MFEPATVTISNDFFFLDHLLQVLKQRYTNHWFPDSPNRGSAYRCIRINGILDPVIAQAGEAIGVKLSHLRKLFPNELTMWIDPSEVAYRIGENGSICVLYEETGTGNTPTVVGSKEFLMEHVLPSTERKKKRDHHHYPAYAAS